LADECNGAKVEIRSMKERIAELEALIRALEAKVREL
jgi:hypothetical protein